LDELARQTGQEEVFNEILLDFDREKLEEERDNYSNFLDEWLWILSPI
jgi:hypothetical protein